MSYCRWSSDFGECDVYVYQHVNGGWTTHVAGRRLKHRMPDEIKMMPRETKEEWIAAYHAERKWKDAIPSKEFPCTELKADGTTGPGTFKTPKDSEYLNLAEISPYAGQTFSDPTPQACAIRLEKIRKSGLSVPQYAIDELKAEEIDESEEV